MEMYGFIINESPTGCHHTPEKPQSECTAVQHWWADCPHCTEQQIFGRLRRFWGFTPAHVYVQLDAHTDSHHHAAVAGAVQLALF